MASTLGSSDSASTVFSKTFPSEVWPPFCFDRNLGHVCFRVLSILSSQVPQENSATRVPQPWPPIHSISYDPGRSQRILAKFLHRPMIAILLSSCCIRFMWLPYFPGVCSKPAFIRGPAFINEVFFLLSFTR